MRLENLNINLSRSEVHCKAPKSTYHMLLGTPMTASQTDGVDQPFNGVALGKALLLGRQAMKGWMAGDRLALVRGVSVDEAPRPRPGGVGRKGERKGNGQGRGKLSRCQPSGQRHRGFADDWLFGAHFVLKFFLKKNSIFFFIFSFCFEKKKRGNGHPNLGRRRKNPWTSRPGQVGEGGQFCRTWRIPQDCGQPRLSRKNAGQFFLRPPGVS